MEIRFNFKRFDPSDHLKSYSRNRLGKIVKYIPDNNLFLTVNMEVDKFRHRADVVLNGPDLHLSATEESEDMYATIDLVWEKLEAQARRISEKNKGRRKKQKYPSVRMDTYHFEDGDSGAKQPKIVASDNYEPKPMAVEEAAMQLENKKENFLVFFNADTERINVIYLQKKGVFAVIDPGGEF